MYEIVGFMSESMDKKNINNVADLKFIYHKYFEGFGV